MFICSPPGEEDAIPAAIGQWTIDHDRRRKTLNSDIGVNIVN